MINLIKKFDNELIKASYIISQLDNSFIRVCTDCTEEEAVELLHIIQNSYPKFDFEIKDARGAIDHKYTIWYKKKI